ncbi:hypothetical protein OAA24_00065 [bacterium]|nr:hypothetical protein [bacterium]
MAELSAETTAIVERLRAEGDLVRNSGTNSIRSVKIKLDRFDGLFTSIQTNIAEQTQILRQQAGIQEAAAENRKRQEDFDNLKAEQEVVEKKNDRAAQEERDAKMIDGMRSAFSLKNLALGAGGAFLGYNLLKGAIDEQFNGAFSNMEKGISEFNPAAIQETFTSLQTSIAGMNTAVNTLNQTIVGLEEDIDAFKSNLAVKAAMFLASIPLGFALARGLAKGIPAGVRAYRQGQLDKNDPRGNQMRPEESEADRLRRIAAREEIERQREQQRQREIERARRVETERFNRASRASEMQLRANPSPTRFTPAGVNYTPDEIGSPRVAANSNVTPRVVPRSNVIPMRTPSSLAPAPSAGLNTTNIIKTTPANNNRPASRSDVMRILNDANNRIPDKWKRAILKLFDFLAKFAIVFKVVDILIMVEILTRDDLSEDDKMKMAGAIIGGIVGSVGGFAGGAAIGLLGGPLAWITVPAGGIAGGVLGGFAGDYLGLKIVEWALGNEPTQGEIESVNAQVRDALGTSQLMAEAAAQYGGGTGQTTTSANYGPPGTGGLGLFDVPAAAISGMGVGSGRVYPNARLSSAQARRIVNVAPGFETNALDAIADLALQNGNTVIIKGGDQTVSPVITQKGGDAFVEAPTIIGGHMDKNMNTYASGPYPGTVYD